MRSNERGYLVDCVEVGGELYLRKQDIVDWLLLDGHRELAETVQDFAAIS